MRIRSAAALASAGIIALAVPAVAAAAPLTGSLGSLGSSAEQAPGYELPTSGKHNGDVSTGCTVDWHAATNFALVEGATADLNVFVSPEFESAGYLRTDKWGDADHMTWRTVAATDRAINDFQLTITLPAEYEYSMSDVTIKPADDPWFAESMQTTDRWVTGLGPEDFDVSGPVENADGTFTFTVTAVDGSLPADSHFVIQYGADGASTADVITASQHLTGTAIPNEGEGPFCGDGIFSGSLGSLFGGGSLSSLSAG
ncbi:hypothetical protein [Tomitella fengzijianii]|uniref:Peptidase n=1 Tax=Tomitella fengzijianii TaxID=2597660 RepID=A0A516X5K6_9ACTN|nr:hypothetical protein [Tomitella fengzijianii]QDQ98334.1 hypothetical protein FO059_14710 [Tomitella fengzijianii]